MITTTPTTTTTRPRRPASAVKLPALPDTGPERSEALAGLAAAVVEGWGQSAALALAAEIDDQVAERGRG